MNRTINSCVVYFVVKFVLRNYWKLFNVWSGKAPGPDGIPVEIYKKFSKKLQLHLLEMFNESYKTGILPPSLRSAIITLVLKPGKPPIASYCPISLMSCDTKILCKALARRIEVYIPKIIMNDQNGFVVERQAFL